MLIQPILTLQVSLVDKQNLLLWYFGNDDRFEALGFAVVCLGAVGGLSTPDVYSNMTRSFS